MALKITVDSFDIKQYLLFSNVYAISLYLSYLILFDRQTNRPTYQERHRSSYQEVKKFMGKRFSMNLTFSSFLPFPLSPPHNHHPDPPPLLSPPLPPHPLPLPSPPPSTSPKGRTSLLLISLPLFIPLLLLLSLLLFLLLLLLLLLCLFHRLEDPPKVKLLQKSLPYNKIQFFLRTDGRTH